MDKKVFQLYGYDTIEKQVQKKGNGGLLLIPKAWMGKRVKIILLEDPK